LLERLAPRDPKVAHDARIQEGEQVPDCDVGLGDAENLPMADGGEGPSRDDEHIGFEPKSVITMKRDERSGWIGTGDQDRPEPSVSRWIARPGRVPCRHRPPMAILAAVFDEGGLGHGNVHG
jgi:hypothetical protein